ncbi:hypothetical protein Tco_0028648, partial [Tanacetum coccineum]
SFVKQEWKEDKVDERNSMIYLKKKLQLLNKKLQAWGKEARKSLKKKRFEIQFEIRELDKQIDSDRVKREFHYHFAFRFSNSHDTRLLFEGSFPRSLSNEQAACGQDVCKAIKEFFASGKFPIGCNPSFISLIPKISDAKFVKDFWPISLIGCQYKIVRKILANSLSVVIDDLVSSEQSAFIKGRKIFDGLMILNEVLSSVLGGVDG